MSVGLPFQKHSVTSRAAAIEATKFAKTARFRVYKAILNNPGRSDKQIQGFLRMSGNTQRPRRIELENAGLIKAVGQNAESTGMVVYAATDMEYPLNPPKDFWRGRMREHRSIKPTPQEIGVAVETMRKAYKLMEGAFPPEAVKVLKWLAPQARS